VSQRSDRTVRIVLTVLNLGVIVALFLSARSRDGVESFAQGALAAMGLANIMRFVDLGLRR
jgi:hypothetical protein